MTDEVACPKFDQLYWAVRSVREEMLAIEARFKQRKREIELDERKLSDLKWKWWDEQQALAHWEHKKIARRRQKAALRAEIKEWVPN